MESAPVRPELGEYYARVMGRHYDVEVLDELLVAVRDAERAREHTGHSRYGAHAGSVVQVRVAAGDHVAAGDAVVVMEAMKMRNELTSEVAGVVKWVAVAEGDKVDSQTALVTIERDDGVAEERRGARRSTTRPSRSAPSERSASAPRRASRSRRCTIPGGPDADRAEKVSFPGEFPFTRGVYPSMYRSRPWTTRQYAGFGTARETNQRFHSLLKRGQNGLSVAFDLPTQMGLDSDDPLAVGEVGRVGVAIDTVDDLATLFEDIPLESVSTSMTINATASILLAMYCVAREERGGKRRDLAGTVQNDILKEYIARGTYIFPPAPSMRIITDMFAWAPARCPSGIPSASAAITFAKPARPRRRRSRFTLADGIAYVDAGVAAGLGWTTLRRGCRSSSTCTTTSSRKWPSSAPRAASGRAS